MHGNNKGLGFTDGSFIAWPELLELLSILNILVQGNLLVILSACDGAQIVKHLIEIKRAPFWGIVAPYERTYAKNVYEGLSGFYKAICSGQKSSQIISALDTNDDHDLKLLPAEYIYVKSHELAITQFLNKAESVVEREFIAQQAIKFEESLKEFLFIDLFPENVDKISKVHNPWNIDSLNWR